MRRGDSLQLLEIRAALQRNKDGLAALKWLLTLSGNQNLLLDQTPFKHDMRGVVSIIAKLRSTTCACMFSPHG